MKEAGLTVGGFYKHFDSRNELVTEAVGSAFGIWQRQMETAVSDGQTISFAKLVDDYLSDVHRKNPGGGVLPSVHWRRRSLAATSGLARLPPNKSEMTLI